MSTLSWDEVMRRATGVAGVRGALIVSVEDGLVVAESAMDDLATGDIAAFASALVSRAERTTEAMGAAAPRALHLAGEHGTLFAVAGASPLWLVAVADPSAELGRLRLLLGDLASVLA